MELCYLCREWYSPTAEVLAEYAEAGYDWDHVNWICPGCEEALAAEVYEENMAEWDDKDEENYEHPF